MTISIKTVQQENADGQDGGYRRRERFAGEFHRTLTLPGPVDSAKLKSDYHNGTLTVTIPKQ